MLTVQITVRTCREEGGELVSLSGRKIHNEVEVDVATAHRVITDALSSGHAHIFRKPSGSRQFAFSTKPFVPIPGHEPGRPDYEDDETRWHYRIEPVEDNGGFDELAKSFDDYAIAVDST